MQVDVAAEQEGINRLILIPACPRERKIIGSIVSMLKDGAKIRAFFADDFPYPDGGVSFEISGM